MPHLNSIARGAALLLLLSNVSSAWAQGAATEANRSSMGNAGVNDGRMIDLTMPSVSDPAAVDMLFKEGSPLTSILDGLNEKGFHIRYKAKHFEPTMTLLSIPESTQIDDVLREILEPWSFRVYRSPMGHLVVTPSKKKTTPAPRDKTHETLKDMVRER